MISFTINSIGYLMATSTITDERLYMKEAYFMQRNGSFPRVYPFLPILSSISLSFFGATKQSFLFIPMLASALTTTLIYFFSLKLYNDDKRAFLSALILISNPLMIWLSSKHMTEIIFTLMLTATFYLIARKDLSLKQVFLGGLFSLLAYFTKYPGLLLILFITLSFVWAKRPKLLLAFLMPTSFLAFYWAYNSLQFGTPFPSEEYSLSIVLSLMNIDLKLALDIVFKIMLGLALLLAYLIPSLIQPIKSLRKKISYSTLSNLPYFKKLIVFFIPFYSLFHIGYYVLISLANQIAWSADHVARYLLPILPLIVLFANFPSKSRSKRIALGIIIMGIGIILGMMSR
ncbi:MAG: ArnT family glycosyltransferase [Nitrososphaerales archaeon]